MIPIKIETLLEGRKVEQNRIEYKEGENGTLKMTIPDKPTSGKQKYFS